MVQRQSRAVVAAVGQASRAAWCAVPLATLALLLLAWLPFPAAAEDGYDLWLRYRPLPAQRAGELRARVSQLVMPAPSPTLAAARDELLRAFEGFLGRPPAMVDAPTSPGALLAGTPASLPLLRTLGLDLAALGNEGYAIRSLPVQGRPATVIAANTDLGVL